MLLASLLYSKCNESTFTRVAPKLLETIVSKGQPKGLATLSALTQLYNISADLQWRLRVLTSLLGFAATDKAKYGTAVRPSLNNLEQRLLLLRASTKDRRDVYDLALSLLPTSEGAVIADLQLKLLKTFDSDLSAGVDKAKSIVLYQVANPSVRFTDTLLDVPAVAQLKGTPVYDLLEIFASKDYKTFAGFAAQNPTLVNSNGLSQSVLESKMRLLTLADLGANHASLTYATISEALSVPEADVELYIVDAIASGLLDARIDQSAKSVIVVHAPQRSFQPVQWVSLGKRLNDAQGRLKDLLGVVRQLRQQNLSQLGVAK
jgi:translation initiation factor 3 subunit M